MNTSRAVAPWAALLCAVVIALSTVGLCGVAWAQGTFGKLGGAASEGQRRAILIGVDRYSDAGFPPLQFAARDASALAGALRDPRFGGFASVDVVAVGDLTARTIVARLEYWARSIQPDDTVLVYWSGHGTRWIDERNRPRVFLATEDSTRSNPIDTAVPLESLEQFLSSLPASRRILVLDACFTGSGKIDGDDATEAADEEFDERLPLVPKAQEREAWLFATTYGRPALESKSLGHGVFTYHLIQAMTDRFDESDADDDQVVSVSEAFDWARDQAMDTTGQRQIPMAIYKIVGREELVLSGDPKSRTRSSLAMVTAYEGTQQGVRLIVDGRERGAFPRSVLIEPGFHTVEFQTAGGKVIDRGRHQFRASSVYRVEALRDALNGGRHQLSLGYQHLLLPGEAWRSAAVPDAPGVRLAYELRPPSRHAILRRFGLAVDLGAAFFGPEASLGGGNAPPSTAVELGAGPLFRLDLTGFMLQIQPRAAALLLLRRGGPTPTYPNWILGSVGADFGVGIRPHNLFSVRVHWAPMFFDADLGDHSAEGRPPIEIYHRIAAAVALGF